MLRAAVIPRLTPTFSRRQRPRVFALQAFDPVFGSQRSPDRFGAAERGVGGVLVEGLAEEGGEIIDARQQRRDRDDAVIAAGEMPT